MLSLLLGVDVEEVEEEGEMKKKKRSWLAAAGILPLRADIGLVHGVSRRFVVLSFHSATTD